MRPSHRARRLLGLIAILIGALVVPLAATAAQQVTCADYTSTAAAQFALDINPGLAASLDPDGNGVACDEAGDTGASSSDTDLQLPAGQTPTAEAPPSQATADVVDQQPTDTTTTTPPQAGALDGRLGSMQQAFEAVHGTPIEEIPSESNPAIVGRQYTPPATATELFVVYFNNQVTIIALSAQAPWPSADATGIIDDYLPQDVTTLPQPEPLADGSLLMPVNSPQLATAVTADSLAQSGLPGAPGDLYLRLTLDSAGLITEVEMGIGNGDNVREDVNSGGPAASTIATPTPAASTPPTPATTTTTTDANAFLQEARAEVDQYRAELAELRAILAAGTFTEAETTRLTEIIVSWMAVDTTPLNAPPEHAAVAELLQTIHADLSTVGAMLLGIMGGDQTNIQTATDTLGRIETNLNALDQQLIALGF